MSEVNEIEGDTVKFEIETLTTFEAPRGTTFEELPEGHGAFILPNGKRIKSFVVFEADEEEDLNHQQMLDLGCEAEDTSRIISQID